MYKAGSVFYHRESERVPAINSPVFPLSIGQRVLFEYSKCKCNIAYTQKGLLQNTMYDNIS